MDHRLSESFGLQLRDAEQTVRRSLAEVCAKRPPSRPNTGELIRVADVLAIAGGAVKHAIALRRRRRVDDVLHAGRSAMAEAEAMLARNTAHRAFTDSRHTLWDVFDVYLTGYPTARTQVTSAFQRGWLCFESIGEKRRLGPIPPGWQSLADHDLEELLLRASMVPRARRRRSRPAD